MSTLLAALADARKCASDARRLSVAGLLPGGGSDRRDAVSAIDGNDRAGEIGSGRRGQEQHRAVEISRPPEPAQRYPRFEPLAGVAAQEIAGEIGFDKAGREGIDENAIA